MRSIKVPALALTLAMGLVAAGCGDDQEPAAPPPPEPLTRDAIGHYCNMIVADHPGPKGQIHLDGRDHPVWFSSVRDAIAFTRLPEESKAISAIYVNDMASAQSWDSPEPGTWIAATDAWYVIESDARGGMGAFEAVPFGDKTAAEAFVAARGGRIVVWTDIPTDFVLGDVEKPPALDMKAHGGHEEPGHDSEPHDAEGQKGHGR